MCKLHPKYKAVRPPVHSHCLDCWWEWVEKNPSKKISGDQVRELLLLFEYTLERRDEEILNSIRKACGMPSLEEERDENWDGG